MNTENLIKIITEEVLKRINMLSPQNSREESKSILILDSYSQQNKSNYEAITSRWKDTKFLGDWRENDGIESFDYIVVPDLSNKDLVNLANGAGQNKVCKIVVDAILQGKKVIVLEEGICYRKFKDTANENFFNMFKSYEEKIVSFGIEIVAKRDLIKYLDHGDCKETMQNRSQKTEKLETKQGVEINTKVVSERNIEKLLSTGHKTIYVNKKSIITPLAIDFIRTNDINVIRK